MTEINIKKFQPKLTIYDLPNRLSIRFEVGDVTIDAKTDFAGGTMSVGLLPWFEEGDPDAFVHIKIWELGQRLSTHVLHITEMETFAEYREGKERTSSVIAGGGSGKPPKVNTRKDRPTIVPLIGKACQSLISKSLPTQ